MPRDAASPRTAPGASAVRSSMRTRIAPGAAASTPRCAADHRRARRDRGPRVAPTDAVAGVAHDVDQPSIGIERGDRRQAAGMLGRVLDEEVGVTERRCRGARRRAGASARGTRPRSSRRAKPSRSVPIAWLACSVANPWSNRCVAAGQRGHARELRRAARSTRSPPPPSASEHEHQPAAERAGAPGSLGVHRVAYC